MPPPTVPSRCWTAIYTRQSRSFLGDFSSCEAQLSACLKFVMARLGDGWVWNGRRYDDEGQSGETLDRPGLQRLLADVRRGATVRAPRLGAAGGVGHGGGTRTGTRTGDALDPWPSSRKARARSSCAATTSRSSSTGTRTTRRRSAERTCRSPARCGTSTGACSPRCWWARSPASGSARTSRATADGTASVRLIRPLFSQCRYHHLLLLREPSHPGSSERRQPRWRSHHLHSED